MHNLSRALTRPPATCPCLHAPLPPMHALKPHTPACPPPGSSVSDPTYSHAGAGHSPFVAGTMPEPKNAARPSKRAAFLKLSTRRSNTPLEPQGGGRGDMLPPGCSMSDPHYSVRDPVYFLDRQQ